jgi:hypothetical protein
MNKIEHLKMIQDVINRMAGNSFLTKGWCVTLVSAIIVLGAKELDKRFIIIAFLPVIMFWILDGYFLFQERLFRKLYEFVRSKGKDEEVDFSMDTSVINNEENQQISWTRAIFSKTLIIFYLTMLIAIILTLFLAFKYF